MVKPIVPHATDNIFGAARAIARAIRLLRRRSQREERLRSLLLSTAARDSRRSQLYFELPQHSSAGVGALDDHQSVAMHHRTVVPGAELGGEVAGTAAEQGGQFV